MKDLFGKAILDYQTGNYTEDLITATHISENDVLPLPYLFRNYEDMPILEQKALDLCKGNILDVGCGAGSHSLYLQDKGFDVTSIDISDAAIKACKLRGLKQAKAVDVLSVEEGYDTIISLMNGTGLFQTIQKVPFYLDHMRSLLNPMGQILVDSSDVSYMYDQEDFDWVMKHSDRYFGELEYYISYLGESEEPMTWLYIDFETLKEICKNCNLRCEKVIDGKHFDYLARLTAF